MTDAAQSAQRTHDQDVGRQSVRMFTSRNDAVRYSEYPYLDGIRAVRTGNPTVRIAA